MIIKVGYLQNECIFEENLFTCIWILGTLACLDGYMNIALENTEEYVEGRLKNTYGDTFIRGNNGKFHKSMSRQPY